MAEAKKGKSWSKMGPGEKKAVLVGWTAIVAIGAYFLWPSTEAQNKPALNAVTTASNTVAAAPTALYAAPSQEASAAAVKLMADLEKAMLEGVGFLKAGDVLALSAHSRYFDDLVASGNSKFGSTIFEPLGRCGVTGNFARVWWRAQLDAARNGGHESPPGSIKSSLDQYQTNRTECLKLVGSTAG